MINRVNPDTTELTITTCDSESIEVSTNSFLNSSGCDSLVITNTVLDTQQLHVVITPMDTTINLGDSFQLSVQTNFVVDSLIWNSDVPNHLLCNSCQNPTISPSKSQSGRVTVYSNEGCSISAIFNISVFEPEEDLKENSVYIPSAFTPNNDGINDVFEIYVSSELNPLVRYFDIFDRWGNHIFKAEYFKPGQINSGWDGSFRGKRMDPNVFAWMVEVEFEDGEVITLKGDVSLLN